LKLVGYSIGQDQDNKTCILEIVNHGRCLAPKQRERIFERFSVFRKTGKGSGFGLFIVTKLVDRKN
jgi:signal transduction histidine kinase